jgi:hypothetical protein
VFQPNALPHILPFYQNYTDYTKNVGNTQEGQFLHKEFPSRISKPDNSESVSEISVSKGKNITQIVFVNLTASNLS